MQIKLSGVTLKRITSKGKPTEIPTVEIVFAVEATRALGPLLMFAGQEVELEIESYQSMFEDLAAMNVKAEVGQQEAHHDRHSRDGIGTRLPDRPLAHRQRDDCRRGRPPAAGVDVRGHRHR